MTGRSKRRRGDSSVVDLADVFADDALIDDLIERRDALPAGNPGSGDPLIELFDIWRDELGATPLPPAPPIPAVVAVEERRQRSLRPAVCIAAAICALLLGSAAVGSRTAKPGDTLWPLASVLWSDRIESVNSLREVNLALAEVRSAINAGRSDDARKALVRATVELGHVDDLDMPESMPSDVQKLWVVVAPDGDQRGTATSPSVAAAAPGSTGAGPAGSPSSEPAAPDSAISATPSVGTILEAIIASAQPSVSVASTSPQVGDQRPPVNVLVLPPGAAGSTDPTNASDQSHSSVPSLPVTPTLPPVTGEPAPTTSPVLPPVLPPDPTVHSTTAVDPTTTQQSAPAPPAPTSDPSTHSPTTASPTRHPPTDRGSPTSAGSDPLGSNGSNGPADTATP